MTMTGCIKGVDKNKDTTNFHFLKVSGIFTDYEEFCSNHHQ